MSKVYWLIEAPNPQDGGPRGYIKEIDTNNDFSVYTTIDPHEAIKFNSKESAQQILDNPAFIHAMGCDKGFVVLDHMFDCGISEGLKP